MAHLDLGIIYSDAGRQADALRELKLAAKINPGNVNVHWRLAQLYRGMGRKRGSGCRVRKNQDTHQGSRRIALQQAQSFRLPNAFPSSKFSYRTLTEEAVSLNRRTTAKQA